MTDREATIEAPDARSDASVERRDSRRAFFTAALGAAAAGAGAFAFSSTANAQTITDADILNFLLQVDYLEANYFAFAVGGSAIPATVTGGTTTAGTATGGRQVTFADAIVGQYAREIAADSLLHVNLLRGTIGTTAVASQPNIDLATGASNAFSVAARAAGLVGADGTFDPYASDTNFLLGAYLLKDVGVSAYKGATSLLTSLLYRQLATAVLGTKSYHAAAIRAALFRKGVATPSLIDSAEAFSNARDSLDGGSDLDQGIRATDSGNGLTANIVPADGNGIVFGRAAAQVLNILYLNSASVATGGFFPAGVNGTIKTSAAN